MKTIITGDTHGDFGPLNRLINRKQPDIVIICGDFGFWPESTMHQMTYGGHYWATKDGFDISEIKNQNSKIYWVPGNHEQWNNLEKEYGRRGLKPIPMWGNENIFYCPIGSSEIINGENFLFVGGADSFDKNKRTEGVDWFKQEILNMEDWEFVVDNYQMQKFDTIISHTCPNLFNLSLNFRPEKQGDFSRKVLDEFLNIFEPNKWYFGHWHKYMRGQFKNTDWMCLDHNRGNSKWWVDYFSWLLCSI